MFSGAFNSRSSTTHLVLTLPQLWSAQNTELQSHLQIYFIVADTRHSAVENSQKPSKIQCFRSFSGLLKANEQCDRVLSVVCRICCYTPLGKVSEFDPWRITPKSGCRAVCRGALNSNYFGFSTNSFFLEIIQSGECYAWLKKSSFSPCHVFLVVGYLTR